MIYHYSFDFDYTLADSSAGAILCINHALNQLGYPVAEAADIRKTIGLSLPSTFEFLVSGHRATDIDDFTRLVKQKADEVMLENIAFFDHVETALSLIRQEGNFVSIVSTKFRYRIEAALKRDKLAHLVDCIIGGECVEKVKPDPEGLNQAMRLSGVPAENTFYIGDSETDGECARRAGVKFIAVTSGVTPRNRLEKWSPVRVISGLSELPEEIA